MWLGESIGQSPAAWCLAKGNARLCSGDRAMRTLAWPGSQWLEQLSRKGLGALVAAGAAGASSVPCSLFPINKLSYHILETRSSMCLVAVRVNRHFLNESPPSSLPQLLSLCVASHNVRYPFSWGQCPSDAHSPPFDHSQPAGSGSCGVDAVPVLLEKSKMLYQHCSSGKCRARCCMAAGGSEPLSAGPSTRDQAVGLNDNCRSLLLYSSTLLYSSALPSFQSGLFLQCRYCVSHNRWLIISKYMWFISTDNCKIFHL